MSNRVNPKVFRPTEDEFKDMRRFYQTMIKNGVQNEFGAVKIIPPKSFLDWQTPINYSKLKITSSKLQHFKQIEGHPGCFNFIYSKGNKFTSVQV